MDVVALTEKLESANRAYRCGEATMSDAEYDALEDQLRAVQPDHPLLTRVQDHDEGEEVQLNIVMGSQDKALSLEELSTYYKRVDGYADFNVSEKLDGMSLELTYQDGNLVRACTRGDGFIGTVITGAVLRAKDVPLTLPEGFREGMYVVRGELIMLQKDLQEMNEERREEGLDAFSNVRNGVVGVVKTQKNWKYAKYVRFRAFGLTLPEELEAV